MQIEVKLLASKCNAIVADSTTVGLSWAKYEKNNELKILKFQNIKVIPTKTSRRCPI